MGVSPVFYRWCGAFCATTVAAASLSLNCFQSVIHGVIALNRFTAIIVPHNHKFIWRTRNTKRALLATSAFCLLASVPVVVVSAGYDYAEGTSLVVDMNVRNKQVASYRTQLNAVTKVTLGLGGFALSIASVYRLHKMVKTGQLRDVRHDQNARLLAHSVFMVFAQLLGVFYMALIEIDRFVDLGSWMRFTFMPVYGQLTNAIFCFSAPIFLLILSRNVREAYTSSCGVRNHSESSVTILSLSCDG
ncbi:hypothetical protein AAVH_42444 [Aphelenchoides avenae]|nr:hypothetical protein AAVH_42444 [Aphelenchus avenae]